MSASAAAALAVRRASSASQGLGGSAERAHRWLPGAGRGISSPQVALRIALCRPSLTVVAEGVTEVGFVRSVLVKALASELQPLGFHVADGGGHDTTIELLESLSEGGMRFGGFADDENRHPTRWANVQMQLGPLLFRWKSGDVESNLVDALADDQIEAFVTDPDDEKTGRRLRSLAMRLKIEPKDFASIKVAAGPELKRFIKEAAGGKVPEGTPDAEKKTYSKQAQDWFKTERGGRELAEKLFDLGVWPALKVQLLPFCNAVRAAAGLPALEDLSS